MESAIVRVGDFDSDDALMKAIEELFVDVEPDSKRAWEEYHEIRNFGLPAKPQGVPMQRLEDMEQGEVMRVHAKTYALETESEDAVPVIRGALYSAVKNSLNGHPKKALRMFWRMRPTLATDHDFTTVTTKYRIVFRIGAYAMPNWPKFEGCEPL